MQLEINIGPPDTWQVLGYTLYSSKTGAKSGHCREIPTPTVLIQLLSPARVTNYTRQRAKCPDIFTGPKPIVGFLTCVRCRRRTLTPSFTMFGYAEILQTTANPFALALLLFEIEGVKGALVLSRRLKLLELKLFYIVPSLNPFGPSFRM